jgi:hypothetical protein
MPPPEKPHTRNGKLMSKVETDNDDLRPEYDLGALRVRKLGPGRTRFGDVVRLAPDVVQVFPDAESVNEALRFLIRATRDYPGPSPAPAEEAGRATSGGREETMTK